jgi:hypothetical protein
MTQRYDLLKMIDGLPIWFAAAESLHEAKKLVDQERCACIVMDSVTSEKVVVKPDPESDGNP